jgi:hypothetical protein
VELAELLLDAELALVLLEVLLLPPKLLEELLDPLDEALLAELALLPELPELPCEDEPWDEEPWEEDPCDDEPCEEDP